MSDRLDDILSGEAEEKKEERNPLAKVYMAKPALEKARIYAELSKDFHGDFIECYGYLMGSKNKKHRIIEDVYYAPGQTGSGAHTKIPGRKVTEAGREINQLGRKVLGWWHSHANYHTFHSGTDDENIITVLDHIAPSNFITTYLEYDFLGKDIKKTKFENDTVFVCDRNNNSKRLEMIFDKLDENPLMYLPLKEVKVRIPIRTGFAYSVVVNAVRGDPYAALATRKFCPTCGSDEDTLDKGEDGEQGVELRILDYNPRIEINVNKMREEVKRKLNSRYDGRNNKSSKIIFEKKEDKNLFVPIDEEEQILSLDNGVEPESILERTRRIFKRITGVKIGQND